ncbi:MAG: hypothetical protein ACRENA_16520 [Vulcanimicrobiaceae bacterium]
MKPLSAISIAGATAWLVTLAVRASARDGDPWWQRWLGERILHEHALPRALGSEAFAANGAPWTPQEWLYSLLLALTQDHHAAWIMPAASGLAAGIALAGVATRCSRRGVSDAYGAAAVLLCMVAMLQSFGARPQVFGWAGLSLLLLCLESDGIAAWACVPLTALWANLHASVLISPLVALLFALAQPSRRRFAIAAACALAVFATPLGADLPRYAVALALSPIRGAIAEWAATSTNSFAFMAGALPLLLILAIFGRELSARDKVLTAAFVPGLFFAVRNVPLFSIAIAPIALSALPARTASARSRIAFGLTAASIAVAFAAISIAAWYKAPSMPSIPSRLAVALKSNTRTEPRVFCEDFAWCSLFLSPETQAQVFMDGRADPYPPALWSKYRDVIDGRRDWAAILDAYRVDAVLVRRNGALDSLLATSTAWKPLAVDGQARLYIKHGILTVRQRSVNARATVRSGSMGPWKT